MVHYFCKRLLQDICGVPCTHSQMMEREYIRILNISNRIPSRIFSSLEVEYTIEGARRQWREITNSLLFHFQSRNKRLRFILLFTISKELMKMYAREKSDIALLIPYWFNDSIIEFEWTEVDNFLIYFGFITVIFILILFMLN